MTAEGPTEIVGAHGFARSHGEHTRSPKMEGFIFTLRYPTPSSAVNSRIALAARS